MVPCEFHCHRITDELRNWPVKTKSIDKHGVLWYRKLPFSLWGETRNRFGLGREGPWDEPCATSQTLRPTLKEFKHVESAARESAKKQLRNSSLTLKYSFIRQVICCIARLHQYHSEASVKNKENPRWTHSLVVK